jgi:hypothetical protein
MHSTAASPNMIGVVLWLEPKHSKLIKKVVGKSTTFTKIISGRCKVEIIVGTVARKSHHEMN